MSEAVARKVYDLMYAEDYCSQWMGIELISISQGSVVLKMQVKKAMLNGFGILHGGIAYTLADSAMAFASNSHDQLALTIQASMSYAKSASEGDILYAHANELKLGKSIAEYGVEIKNEHGEVYYRYRGNVYRKTAQLLNT